MSNNIPKPTHFGKNLKFLRRLKGLSQTALSKHLGLSRNNIASYESGIVEPNSSNFLKACDFFGIQPRLMLESIVSESPLEMKNTNDQELDVLDQHLVDQLDQFVNQTNEMTKVLEGYKAFFDMKRDSESYKNHKVLYSTLDDLLVLLESLVGSNWSLIQSVIPNLEDED